MFLLRILLTVCFIIVIGVNGAEDTGPLDGYNRPGSLQNAMNTHGIDTKLASILDRYYRNNFSSEREWEELKSIRYEGTLQLPYGEFLFNAYKKKPHYYKLTVLAPNGGNIVMAYDGVDAWQSNTMTPEPSLTSMSEAEAGNFIRDATIGGHLLYPLIEGKKIELLGAAVVGKDRCYEIQVTLPDDQVIRSFLNISDYTERRRVTTNQVSGLEEVITNSDFRKIGSIRIPFHSILTREGAQVHVIHITEAKANEGAMNWMFVRPKSDSNMLSGYDSPITPKSLKISEASEIHSASEYSFGTYFGTDNVFDIRIKDNQSGQIDAILRDAGVPRLD